MTSFGELVQQMMEVVEEHFDDFNVTEERACWRVNPFLWALYCAGTGHDRALVDDAPTEAECLAYFVEVFAVSRAASLMEERSESNVQ